MPYLRFSRDKRGYEHTYVLHTFRRDGRSHPRLLYWFRTPPNVKVGRVPLDADAIRVIEESNPDLSFDWTKTLKVRRQSPQPPKTRGPRKTAKGSPTPVEPPPIVTAEAPPVKVVHEEMVAQEVVSTEAARAEVAADIEATEGPVVAPDSEPPGYAIEPAPDVDEGEDDDEGEAEWQHPVVTLMGNEALARIRARYAEIQVRIAEKLGSPGVDEEIRARAEALNPDRWATIEEAVRGIETFEAETEAIRGVLGRRRPRSRRGGDRPVPDQEAGDDVQKA